MISALIVLTFSSALFFFYIQSVCEKVLRREFGHPYFQDVIEAIQLEYPRLRDASASNVSMDYREAHHALECDFVTLAYLLKSNDRTGGQLSWRERILFLYFRFLLTCLPIRHTLNLRERDAVLSLATILQYFTNLLGERLNGSSLGSPRPNLDI